MKTVLTAALLIAFAFCSPVLAKTPKGGDSPAGKLTIMEANAVSVTVSAGRTGDQQMTYKITDATSIKINGLPASGRDLRGGMLVRIEVGSDKVTAQSIEANNPPKPTATPQAKKGKRK